MTRTGLNFLSSIAARRHVVEYHAARRPKRRIRVRPQRQPDAIRRTYNDALQRLAASARERVRVELYPHGPALVDEMARLHGDVRIDSPASTTAAIFRKLSRDYFAEFTPERIAQVVKGYGVEISDFQRAEVARQFERVIGFDPFRIGEAWLPERIEGFTAENVALIRTIPERYFGDVESTLLRDLRAGMRWEEIAPELETRFGVSGANAERIARDQTGKFFGELNAARQQDVGVVRYTWRTARDNRVRDSHVELEGSVFSWESGGDPEEGNPGEAVNCRCQAEPDMTELLEALE